MCSIYCCYGSRILKQQFDDREDQNVNTFYCIKPTLSVCYKHVLTGEN